MKLTSARVNSETEFGDPESSISAAEIIDCVVFVMCKWRERERLWVGFLLFFAMYLRVSVSDSMVYLTISHITCENPNENL